jgi:alkylation response protein AidB-like acyl-CoA dehydrogenase
VDFELSDDQVALRDGARSLLDGRATPTQVRAVVDAEGGIDDGLWSAMVEQGWAALAVPEDRGGLGLGIVELALLLEEVGGHVAPAPVLQQALALDALVGGDGPAEVIDALVAGEAVGTVAFSPVTSDGSTVTGRPEPVIHAPSARVLDLSVEYAKERVQFGRPIGSFQAIKHRCADMLVDVEGMRSAVYHAAWALGAGDPDRSVAASTAKTWCSDASRRVMASGLQVHGGIGFTWEHPAHLYLKRAKADAIALGNADRHRARLAALVDLPA